MNQIKVYLFGFSLKFHESVDDLRIIFFSYNFTNKYHVIFLNLLL